MKNQKAVLYFLLLVIFTATSCKSCKNRFSKEPVVKETSYEDSLYAGLGDTTSNDASATNTAAASTSTTAENNATTEPAVQTTPTNTTVSSTSNTSSTNTASTEKKMAAEVEKESDTKYASKRRRGVSSSIYDGVND
jgi:hypothetical protein